MFRRDCGKIIEGFVYPRGQTCSRDVVAKNPMVCHLCKETRLRDEFAEHMRDVVLSLRREGFLIAGAATKGDDDDLPLFYSSRCMDKGACPHQRGAQSHPRRIPQKIPPGATKMTRDLLRRQ